MGSPDAALRDDLMETLLVIRLDDAAELRGGRSSIEPRGMVMVSFWVNGVAISLRGAESRLEVDWFVGSTGTPEAGAAM